MKQWEYKILYERPTEEKLHELGRDGWELSCVDHHQDKAPPHQFMSEWVFKREVSRRVYGEEN